jgi:hypothetical protein
MGSLSSSRTSRVPSSGQNAVPAPYDRSQLAQYHSCAAGSGSGVGCEPLMCGHRVENTQIMAPLPSAVGDTDTGAGDFARTYSHIPTPVTTAPAAYSPMVAR